MFALFRKLASGVSRRFFCCFSAVCFFCLPVLAFAAEEEPEKAPEWVLSYALILLFVGLSIVILLRTANRSESTFSQEELDKMKEEEMKKLTGTHT